MKYLIELGPFPYEHPLVTTAAGVDDALTDAVVEALAPLDPVSVPKSKRWLQSYMNFRTGPDDNGSDAAVGSKRELRRRFQLFLESRNCKVTTSLAARDGSRDVLRHKGSIKDIGIAIATVRRFYEGTLDCGVRREVDGNPMVADASDRVVGIRVVNRKDRYRRRSDNQFRVVIEDWSPPKVRKPTDLIASFVAAAEAANWPPTPLTLLYVMADDAPRSGDVRKLNAADWGRHGFGRVIHAMNKGSKGKRVKTVVVTLKTRTALIDAVNLRHLDNPDLPDFEAMIDLAEEERWSELEKIPLFPSRRGTSISHSGFHKVYFRPTMIGAGITIGGRFAWPHLTRHAGITMRVNDIYRRTKPGERRNALIDNLKAELCFASDQLGTYAWEAILEESIRSRTEFQDRLNSEEHDLDGDHASGDTGSMPHDIAEDLDEMD